MKLPQIGMELQSAYTPGNIQKCPVCNEKYVPTPQSNDKCLFCLRGQVIPKDNFTIDITI